MCEKSCKLFLVRRFIKVKERVYQGIILVLLVLFLVFFIKTNDDYMDLLEVNDEQTALIDKQRIDNEKIVNSWQESYEELQIDYGKLLKEWIML